MTLSQIPVFVYGTLQPGGAYWASLCEGKLATPPQPAKIRGTLYDLHVGYPGLRLEGDGWVRGYVLKFRTAADFHQVDILEGFVPGHPHEDNEYVRFKVSCYTPEGKPMGQVWAYEVTETTLRECGGTRIESGKWPA
ncbi:MAG: gamma-glutamylcyclotransferase [Opitutales bacterium]